MSKCLCGWKKEELKEKWKEYTALVKEPAWVCCKCGRAAADKKMLCKPKKI